MATGTLVIDRFTMNETPQTGTWLMCFKIQDADGNEGIFNIPHKEYEGDGIIIEAKNVHLPEDDQRVELTDVELGAELTFWIGLDDDQADVCTDAEDKYSSTIKVKKKGRKSFHPSGDWDFIISYHWEAD